MNSWHTRTFCSALVVAFLALLAPLSAQAQHGDIDFDRLMQADGVTVVYLSPSMLLQSNIRIGGNDMRSPSLRGLIRAVNSVYIFSSSEAAGINLMRSMFAPITQSTKVYEQLFFVKEGQRTMRFVAKMKGNETNDLYLLVDAPDEYVAISFLGNFTRKQIESAMKQSEHSGRNMPSKNRRN